MHHKHLVCWSTAASKRSSGYLSRIAASWNPPHASNLGSHPRKPLRLHTSYGLQGLCDFTRHPPTL
eukprot:3766563-Amphidinium_carterae.1